jgi:hypothetical protein
LFRWQFSRAFLPKFVDRNAQRELRAGLIAYMRKTAGKTFRFNARGDESSLYGAMGMERSFAKGLAALRMG